MPTYVFKCPVDETEFTAKLSVEARKSGFCPECGRQGTRVYTPVGIVFKGDGFYVNDYKKKEHQNDNA